MSEQWEFQVGDTGRMRNGDLYRLICVDMDTRSGKSLVALVRTPKDGFEYILNFDLGGEYRSGGSLIRDFDLMPPDRVLAERVRLEVDSLVWVVLPGAQAVVVDDDGMGWVVDSSDVAAGERQWQTEGEMMRLDEQFFTTSGHDWTRWIARRPEGV